MMRTCSLLRVDVILHIEQERERERTLKCRVGTGVCVQWWIQIVQLKVASAKAGMAREVNRERWTNCERDEEMWHESGSFTSDKMITNTENVQSSNMCAECGRRCSQPRDLKRHKCDRKNFFFRMKISSHLLISACLCVSCPGLTTRR